MQCKRCGLIWVVAPKKKKSAEYCSSCRAKPAKSVKYDGEACIPHHGQFDALDRPLVDGRLYLPGDRTCHRSDCIRVDHVVGYTKNVGSHR